MKSSAFFEFEKVVEGIYSVYFDAIGGFQHAKGNFEKMQAQSAREFNKSIKQLDSQVVIYGKGDPNKAGSVELFRLTQGEYKQKNSQFGMNYRFMGNMCLIAIYQYWDDYFRGEIASELGIKKDDLRSSIIGDMRLIRHSIIHHKGIANKDVEKCEILTWFRKDDPIFIDKAKLEEIIYHVKLEIRALKGRIEKLQ